MEKKSIQAELIRRFGEPCYTANQLSKMLRELGVTWYTPDRVVYHVKKHAATPKSEGGTEGIGSSIKHVIKKSDLGKLIEGMGVDVTPSQLEKAAVKLGYRTV